MTAAIGIKEGRVSEVEERAVRIACVDSEVPTVEPVERAIEVVGQAEGIVLPVEQYVVEVEVAHLPIGTIEVVNSIDAHKVVEVDFVGSLVLVVGEVELIGHLVGEEQGLLACLLVSHGRYGCHGCEQCCEGDDDPLHNRMY